MMKRSKKQIWTSWALVLTMLLAVFLPTRVADAVDRTSVLTEFTETLKQDGRTLADSDKIDSEKELSVEISFRVPVQGDEPEPANPVNHLDTARFEVSDKFTLLSGTGSKVLKFGDITVAHLTLEESGGKVFANVIFDGDTTVFDGSDPTLNTVRCLFTANLKYDKTGDDGEEKDVVVTLLGKNYTVHVPPAETVYEVTKSGTPNLANRRIDWEVNISATRAGNPVDLNGYKFVDDLNAVGAYVPGTFAVGIASSLVPDYTGNVLSYTFPAGSTSPKTVTFATVIPEGNYFGSGNQSIENKAQLKDSVNEIKKEGTTTVTFTPEWIKKEGTASDSGSTGSYDPKNRTITWTITANHVGATLNDVVITDVLQDGLTFNSAKWQAWDGSAWGSDQVITPNGSGEYAIGNINSRILLTIVTNVPDDTHTTGTKTYHNSASIRWSGLTGPGPGTGSISVGVGYNAMTKTGALDAAYSVNQKIHWTVSVDPKGQNIPDLKVYDLLVYGKSINFSTVTGIPGGIASPSSLTPQYGQKYAGGFTNGTGTTAAVNVIPIMQGTIQVADLLEITGLSPTDASSFTFDSQVVDPDIFAGNKTSSVRNTAMMFSANTWLNAATGSVNYANNVLRKEMLKREAMDNPAAGVNNVTTNATEGFHYIDKSVIFRLSVNADGINWKDIKNGAGELLGKVTVTDSLPAGWEFAKFAGGEDFLIFEGVKNGNSVNANDTTPNTVTGLTSNFSGGTATFTFDQLAKSYVILFKAKPNAATIQDYFGTNHSGKTATNTVGLKAEKWEPGVSTTRNVSIVSTILSKMDEKLKDGEVKWTVEYRSYNLAYSDPRRIEDTLPVGLDLRTDSAGKLLLDGNVTVNEMILQANGTYTVGNPVALVLGGNISYDNASRTLKFAIPENNKAYRLTYITDVTGTVGTVRNSVKLIAGGSNVEGQDKPYSITAQDGSATLQRNGWLEITKTDGSGALLPGAEFTLFAMDDTTVIRQGTTGIDGKARLKVIPDGAYFLRETKAPAGGYTLEGVTHAVTVKTAGTTITTSIDGKTGTGSNLLSVKNFLTGTVGSLTIRKAVAGNAAEAGREFDFTVTLSDTVNTYTYTGADGGPSGSIKGSAVISLADGQSVTITGLPQGLTYSVVEEDYTGDGYVTVKTGETGAIVADVTAEAVFTNTKNAPGTLTISKTVAGNAAEEGKKFEFTITLSDTANTYTYTGANGGPSGSIKGSATIELAGGQSITIADLREGTTYQVTEKDYSSEGYTTVKTGDEGKIETNGTYVAAITNAKERTSPSTSTGSLTISKKVAGTGASATKKFEFTVTFNAAGTYSYTGHGVSNGTIESGDRISLAHGQSITIKGLPKGTAYTVTEEDYTADGYSAISTGDAGMINGGMTKNAKFTNTKRAVTPGALMIQKTVIGDDDSKQEAFTFVVTLNVSGRYQYSGSKTGTIASGEAITLSHGEYIEIEGLLAGTSYRVIEREANRNGYYTSSTDASGKISASGNTTAFVNTRISVPKTGDNSTIKIIGIAIFSVLLVMIGSAILIQVKRSLIKRH